MENVEHLKAKISELENKLKLLTAKHVRGKIETMSAEVVDSNPYRYYS
jgi:phage shock protein A